MASVTVPLTKPVGTVVMRIGAAARQDALEEPDLEGVGARGVLDADRRQAAVTGVDRVAAVEEIDGAVLPELDLDVEHRGRAEDLDVWYSTMNARFGASPTTP